MTAPHTVHAFADDALAASDATDLARRIRDKEVSPVEVAVAAVRRAESVQPSVNAVEHPDYERAQRVADDLPEGRFRGVPTFVKDNIDVAGLPTNHGTRAFTASPARSDGRFVGELRAQGLNILGKSRLPEFGFSASTEYADAAPVRNPWNPAYSAGASSGGSAALVAAGVVPIAHANDGGGSIRIPAAVCGLVGLKPSRGRLFSDAEHRHRNPSLPPVRAVTGPGATRLRVGVVLDSVNGAPTDVDTRDTVLATAELIGSLGHHVEEMAMPATDRFADDFSAYWGLLGLLVSTTGKRILHPEFDTTRTEELTRGLARMCRERLVRIPGVVHRLRRSTAAYRRIFTGYDVVLSPVLAHTTPRIGHLSPTLPFDELFARLQAYVGFTPLNNAAGGPAISLPLGRSREGLPVGCHLSADLGDERTLLELALELEEAQPFMRIQDV